MEVLIVIFLLFLAVLAYGWFYLQRAKARPDTGTTVEKNEPGTPAS